MSFGTNTNPQGTEMAHIARRPGGLDRRLRNASATGSALTYFRPGDLETAIAAASPTMGEVRPQHRFSWVTRLSLFDVENSRAVKSFTGGLSRALQ